MSITVITFGTFDVLHVGHLRILQRSRALGDRLVVGVSSDELNFSKKSRYPVFSQAERCELVANLKCVDEVFVEESLELKREYVQKFAADVLVMAMTGPASSTSSTTSAKSPICRVPRRSRRLR